MPKNTWIIAGVLAVIAALTLGGFQVKRQTEEMDSLKRQLVDTQATADGTTISNAVLAAALSAAHGRIEELETKIQAAGSAQAQLEQQMRAALESKEVTISELRGKLTVNILDRVLFDSGDAVIKPE